MVLYLILLLYLTLNIKIMVKQSEEFSSVRAAPENKVRLSDALQRE